MSDQGQTTSSVSPQAFWPARLPYAALAGVRTRRIGAICLDLIAITIIFTAVLMVLFVLGIVTFGLTWFLIPPLFPAIALFYNGMTISGWRMATPGMRAMDLEMRTSDGGRVPFLTAAVHAVLFYLSWTILTPLVLLVSLIANDKRCLHDIVAGVVVTRRA
ncbi:MAG: domain containing protein [Hyphomicrobiales bacterium]|nr:domain containing protein [Hyphomicrobiales bacterium]